MFFQQEPYVFLGQGKYPQKWRGVEVMREGSIYINNIYKSYTYTDTFSQFFSLAGYLQ